MRDHPRSCGKDIKCRAVGGDRGGSPPLVRERPYAGNNAPEHDGITPARAGKTQPPKTEGRKARDHPRSCGKDTEAARKRSKRCGSPPLVRERQIFRIGPFCLHRITPARAGKTVMDSFIFALLRLLTFKIYSTSLPNI